MIIVIAFAFVLAAFFVSLVRLARFVHAAVVADRPRLPRARVVRR